MRDLVRAAGTDPDRYISPPTPMALGVPISAEEAVLQIMDGNIPQGTPFEGAEVHFQKLVDFMGSDDFGFLEPPSVQLFQAYLSQVQQIIAQERAMLAQAAGAFEGGGGKGKPGPEGSPQPGAQAMPPINGGELYNEALPGAGGGANP